MAGQSKRRNGANDCYRSCQRQSCETALDYDVDVLWIGAFYCDPFIVQEIADALEGTDKIVLVKNPVNPDLALWLGGIERLYSANIKKLGVIHRGFSTYDKSKP